MKQHKSVADTVWDLAEPVAESLGYSLWDVEYVKDGSDMILRITIDTDRKEGITINDCEAMHRAMDPVLDEADPIAESYVFEVGSAGADRELKRPRDYEQFMGSEVEIHLYRPLEGSKRYVGVLRSFEDGAVCIEQNGSLRRFEKDQIAQVRLYVGIG